MRVDDNGRCVVTDRVVGEPTYWPDGKPAGVMYLSWDPITQHYDGPMQPVDADALADSRRQFPPGARRRAWR